MPKKKPKVTRVYANMDWYEIAEQPDGFDSLPDAFRQAHALWKKDKKKNIDKILSLLQPFVTARFVPGNISGWEQLFVDPNGGEFPEFEASKIHLAGVEYGDGPIPSAKAEAIFEVTVTDDFGQISDFEEWQSNNDFFHSAVSFGWNIPREESTEDLDFMHGNHSGCECSVVGNDNVGKSWATPGEG